MSYGKENSEKNSDAGCSGLFSNFGAVHC